MDRNFAEALKLVLKHEGGWSDHRADPGGATMKGITLATFRRYVDAKATKDDLRHITQAQIADVYKRHYWDKVRGGDLPDGVDYATFDFAVNSGPGRAAQFLQRVVGVAADGKIGRQTLAAVRSLPADQTIKTLCVDRMAFLRGLKTWKTFGKGWASRVEGVRAAALKMAALDWPAGEAPSEVNAKFREAMATHPSPPATAPAKTDMGIPITPPPSPPAATPEPALTNGGFIAFLVARFLKGLFK